MQFFRNEEKISHYGIQYGGDSINIVCVPQITNFLLN